MMARGYGNAGDYLRGSNVILSSTHIVGRVPPVNHTPVSYTHLEDYYSGGQMIWLEAAALIRAKIGGKMSLDDFAMGFFGVNNGEWAK